MWALSRRLLSELGIPPGEVRLVPGAPPHTTRRRRGEAPRLEGVASQDHRAGLVDVTVAVAGTLSARPRVAIVGARAPTRRAIDMVVHLVDEANAAGLAVLSGGARGIDGEVHAVALQRDVRQGIVLPLHLSTPYPPEHEPLFREVLARGDAIVCPVHEGTVPGRWAFVARNRWLVALSSRVVVVEAALRSGSTQTGRLALAMGRPVGAFAGSPGGDALIAAGAVPLGHLGDLDRERLSSRVQSFYRHAVAGHAALDEWPSHLAALASCLGPRRTFTLEEIGLGHFAALLDAESRGLVVRVDATRWARVGEVQGAADGVAPSVGAAPSAGADEPASSKGPKL